MAVEPKKQLPLRLSPTLFDDLCVWAEAEFRSVNGQIEYLLTSCVREHKKSGGLESAPKEEK